ncbi:MAG TPA: heparinase II/III family protein [Roseiarcus sp.]|nr:heparinase II/III family protein [Roseiarcus sp.]
MSSEATAIKMRLFGLATRLWLLRLARPFANTARRLMAIGARRPERLAIAPRDIRTADPIAARDIYAGYFVLAGRTANAHGRSPFEMPPPSPAWGEALHGFGWLRDLAAADTALSRANAQALVEDWLNVIQRSGRSIDASIVHDPRVVARRLLSWLSHSPMILENADRAFYRRFARSLGAQAAPLERALAGGLTGEARLTAAIALTQTGLSLENASALLQRATRVLAGELTRQILADGGHVSRNPQVLVELLVDLLPTRQAFAARGLSPPEQLLNAIDRMTPILRMFRHADGALANFNGMGVSEPQTLATLLAYGDTGAAIMDAPYSGYERLEAGPSVAIIDVGAPPPWEFAQDCHAGCLSFEFSSGYHRLIVNCGAPPPDLIEARAVARATAAHSTLVVADRSSCRFAAATGLESFAKGAVLQGPSRVEAKRSVDSKWLRVDADHDGYGKAFGVLHHRTLALTQDGTGLYGEDRLSPVGKAAPVGETPIALRFHLHPDVHVALDGDGVAARLFLPSGDEWRFEAGGRPIVLEESIFFATPGRPRRSTQLAAHGTIADCAPIVWSLIRSVGETDPSKGSGAG